MQYLVRRVKNGAVRFWVGTGALMWITHRKDGPCGGFCTGIDFNFQWVYTGSHRTPREGFFKRKIKRMKIAEYLKETRAEMRHVNWPTKEQTISFTVLVIAFSLVIAFFLGFFDFLFVTLIEKLIL